MRHYAIVRGPPEDHSQHADHQIDGEDIVGISEEADTGHDDGADMIPTKRSLVDFREGKTSPFIGIRYRASQSCFACE